MGAQISTCDRQTDYSRKRNGHKRGAQAPQANDATNATSQAAPFGPANEAPRAPTTSSAEHRAPPHTSAQSACCRALRCYRPDSGVCWGGTYPLFLRSLASSSRYSASSSMPSPSRSACAMYRDSSRCIQPRWQTLAGCPVLAYLRWIARPEGAPMYTGGDQV